MKKEIDTGDDNGDETDDDTGNDTGDNNEDQTSVSQLLSSTLDLFLSIRPLAPPVALSWWQVDNDNKNDNLSMIDIIMMIMLKTTKNAQHVLSSDFFDQRLE